jgi:hypothetical protein
MRLHRRPRHPRQDRDRHWRAAACRLGAGFDFGHNAKHALHLSLAIHVFFGVRLIGRHVAAAGTARAAWRLAAVAAAGESIRSLSGAHAPHAGPNATAAAAITTAAAAAAARCGGAHHRLRRRTSL